MIQLLWNPFPVKMSQVSPHCFPSFFFFFMPFHAFLNAKPKSLTPKSFLHPHPLAHCSSLHSLYNFREYGLVAVLIMIQQALEDNTQLAWGSEAVHTTKVDSTCPSDSSQIGTVKPKALLRWSLINPFRNNLHNPLSFFTIFMSRKHFETLSKF